MHTESLDTLFGVKLTLTPLSSGLEKPVRFREFPKRLLETPLIFQRGYGVVCVAHGGHCVFAFRKGDPNNTL